LPLPAPADQLIPGDALRALKLNLLKTLPQEASNAASRSNRVNSE